MRSPDPLQVNPAALVDLWRNKFLLRVTTKMTLGNILGSAVLDVLNNTATLEVKVPSAVPGSAGDGGEAVAAAGRQPPQQQRQEPGGVRRGRRAPRTPVSIHAMLIACTCTCVRPTTGDPPAELRERTRERQAAA